MSRIAAVIPSWNTRELLAKCLAALERSDVELETLVVDDHSSDGSVEMVEREHPRARILRNETNLGFTAACNRGIQATKSEFVLLLNSDAEVAPDAISMLARFLEQNGSYAAAAPRLVNPDGTTQHACMNFPGWRTPLWFGTPLERWFPDNAEIERYFARSFTHEHDSDVEQPPAAALMLRRSALEGVGLLDETMTLFFSDVDLSKRLARSGWRTRFLQAAKVLHVGGASTRQFPARLERWHLDRLRYFRKHHGSFAGSWVKGCTTWTWADFVVVSLARRFRPRAGAPAEPLGPTTRAFLRFLAS